MTLKAVIEDASTPAGRFFDLTIQLLIVLSLITFSIETLPDLSPATIAVLQWFELGTVVIFTLEYLLRVVVADRWTTFVFSFQGLIDFAAVAPFYLARGLDLRAIRVVRLFRLLRVFKLLRYSKALQRLKDAFREVKAELVLFCIMALVLLFIASVGIYYCERDAQPEAFASIFHSMWWSVTTLTTVGYGDTYPITVAGRIFTFFVLFVGLAVVAVPSGLFAAALTKTAQDSPEEVSMPAVEKDADES